MATGESAESLPGEARYTRKGLFGVAAGGALVTAALGIRKLTESSNPQSENLKAQAEAFDMQISDGLRNWWDIAAVWPGIAIVPSNVELYGSAALLLGSKIEWPKQARNEHLAIQRPFLINQSAKFNRLPMVQDSVTGSDEVLGFWLPGSDKLAYVDQTQNRDGIMLASHSGENIWTGDGAGINGEEVTLQFPLKHDGLTYRYINTPYKDFEGHHWTVKKVLGRSAWLPSGEASAYYYAFTTGEGSDLVQLPEAKK